MVQINDQTHPILGLIYTHEKVNLILRNVISKLFPPHLPTATSSISMKYVS